MYKCGNCNAEFEQYDIINDNYEKWHVCPYCRGAEFTELKRRADGDKFKLIGKDTVIDSVVNAIAFVNQEKLDTAKEILIELITEMLPPSPFDFKEGLDNVFEECETRQLIGQLQTAVEFSYAN